LRRAHIGSESDTGSLSWKPVGATLATTKAERQSSPGWSHFQAALQHKLLPRTLLRRSRLVESLDA